MEIIKVLGKALIPVREKSQTFIFCHTLLKWRDQIYWGELFYMKKKTKREFTAFIRGI